MSNKWVHLLAALACFPAAALAAPLPVRLKPQEEVAAKGQTVVLGTWTWKVEEGTLGAKGGDFWWEQVNDRERYLVPRGGAGWAVLSAKEFERVTRDDLAKAAYAADRLSGAVLVPGTVVAVRTADGKLAKLKVVRYRELHDFTFPEASHLSPAWRALVLQKPNTLEYHLEVSWVVYKGK